MSNEAEQPQHSQAGIGLAIYLYTGLTAGTDFRNHSKELSTTQSKQNMKLRG